MFKKSDIGRRVQIKNTNGADWIGKNIYIIEEVYDPRTVKFEGVEKAWITREKDYYFLETQNIEIGDEISIDYKIQSFSKNEIKKVIGKYIILKKF